ERGSIASLIGPNGAGKTTVFNVITGIYRPDNGSVWFDGRDISGMKPHTVAALGIGRTFQTLRLFGTLSCLENVMASRHSRSRAGRSEEHTSELQSRENLVCRLLLEKKKRSSILVYMAPLHRTALSNRSPND